VVVSQNDVANQSIPAVQAKILVHKPIDQVWKVVADPVKLASGEKKVRKVEVVSKRGNQQNVAYTVAMAKLLPPFNYVVMQQLSPPSAIKFHRVSGSFKDIQGSWGLSPAPTGKNTVLTYTLKLDPGPLVPKGMLLSAVKSDLPNFMRNTRSAIESAP
jgi:ribosome-associated toxin RatA of RatAB toxin-antitoxin module